MDNKKHSVLVVDDLETNLEVLKRILTPEYTVYMADNGQDAIEAAEKYLPDVILLDILMMYMDGYAVITELKRSEKTQDIPVIFVTSLDSVDDEAKGLTLGAVDYITKPFSPVIVKLRLQNQIKMLEQLRTIERLSMLDQLTELPNRRCFENRLREEWGRAQREQTPISILIIDIDNFKHYNDTYGHQQGDVALQMAARVFNKALKRNGDIAARWGGEEFIILLPNTDADGAHSIADEIRKNTEDMRIPCADGTEIGITVCVGVNTRERGQGGSTDEFISKADNALYVAKDTGRNKVCSYKN